jgi:hypothetical protein
MMIALGLELALLFVVAGSHDPRTRIVGVILWTAYLRYSATAEFLRGLFAGLRKWFDDQEPPGGAA